MKTNFTELVFILDRSGSMSGLEQDTIGGFNSLLSKQKHEEGEAVITTILFDDNYEILHDRIDIKGVSPISEREYYVGGSTALLDAIGKTIGKIEKVQQNTKEDRRADKVLFVIITDGEENASQEFNYSTIRNLVEKQKKMYDWEFIFLGANIDAIATAESFGIKADRAATYKPSPKGTRRNYEAISEVICDLRSSKVISEDWKERIEKDEN